jgi:hypothetical protein
MMKKKDRTPTQGHTVKTSERCSIAVVYTDQPSRQRAFGICDSLAGRFGPELQLEFTWWNTRYLQDSTVAQLASEAVANSDLILFSTDANATLTPEVKRWLEVGMPQSQRERAFAAYLDKHPGGARRARPSTSALDSYLRTVARQARMDYLALAPSPAAEPALEPQQGAPLSRWGINE